MVFGILDNDGGETEWTASRERLSVCGKGQQTRRPWG